MPLIVPDKVAAVDLGSNSFHMLVCNLKDGKIQTLDRLKETVRLASGLNDQDLLDEATQERALACLERFGERIKGFPRNSVRVVGTNTLRTAKNSYQFIKRAEQTLGHAIHIISGIEEARLIYQGVSASLGSRADNRFVMDIGGGSTEYIIGSGHRAHTKESLHLGCVTFTKMFFMNGRLSKKAFMQAVLLAEQRLEPFQLRFHRDRWDEAIGASGSLKAVHKVLLATGWSNNGITRDGLQKLVEHICQCRHVDELNLPDLSQDRMTVFPAGVAIVYATFRALHIEQMTVSEGALREGVIHDLLGRIHNRDVRSETSQTLAEYYRADLKHAKKLQETLHYMIAQLHDDLSANADAVQFLMWAAELHEIGIGIAHSQYHKHSAYIIENGDLEGFSRQDQLVLAAIVRTHRKKFSLTRFENLPQPWDQVAPVLAVLLRLAVLLHRNRNTARPDFDMVVDHKNIRLRFASGWLAQAPLTTADLQLEAKFLDSAQFDLDFK